MYPATAALTVRLLSLPAAERLLTAEQEPSQGLQPVLIPILSAILTDVQPPLLLPLVSLRLCLLLSARMLLSSVMADLLPLRSLLPAVLRLTAEPVVSP